MRISLSAMALLVVVALVVPPAAEAQHVSADLMIGSAINLPTPLTVTQEGFPDLRLSARYDTKPFGPFAPYYSWRLTFWRSGATQGWEVQQVHHRIFLENTTAEIQQFDVHYGYNYFLVGYAWKTGAGVVHASGGAVVANPVNRIRGKGVNTNDVGSLNVNYRLAGVGAALTLSRDLRVTRYLRFMGEVALAVGSASVPVVGGSAKAPNVGVHGRVGVGLDF